MPEGAQPDLDALVARWHAQVAHGDPAALWDWLHPDAVFESPIVHTPQRGRAIAFRYLASAGVVLGGEGFRYVGEWRSTDGVVLEFTQTIQGIVVNGIDMIRFDAQGRIVHFKVMVRPLKAIELVHRLMAEQLPRTSAPAGGPA
ncbi:MAG: nuclear transport factor 2 family protein [Sphingomonadaceae bacterium]|uniref:nuclear transport factor 2 family protein n=1 Tax=Thermaurantiacus sp. TaxID=2820283 RepID=UPI00298F2826|nr:nuclear transport factor 2 family protein [Thermaurantiacus sp.]MCS6985962.1 nuclear transport factor 2 family protein [Sphingomonadaceae bacterium]MDW8414822.1 nuclear transport factor 2 family protein [Thermaurantiacus sp.]